MMGEPSVDERLARISGKLREAAARGLQPFGAESHGFRLEPPLSGERVAELEARHGVELPAGYRAFATRVADGGAGPAYGLFPLERALRGEYGQPPEDHLRTPFPHTAAYDPGRDPEVLALWNRADRGEVPEEEADRVSAYADAGTLPLCHEGCGYLHLLVVTGPARGQMWMDARCSDGGFVPLGTSAGWTAPWPAAAAPGGWASNRSTSCFSSTTTHSKRPSRKPGWHTAAPAGAAEAAATTSQCPPSRTRGRALAPRCSFSDRDIPV